MPVSRVIGGGPAQETPRPVSAPAEVEDASLPDLDLESAFFDYSERIRTFALRIGVPTPDVDDLVSETFLIAHERRETFVRSRSVLPWLFGIAFNRARAHRRRGWLRNLLKVELAREPLPASREGPEDALLRSETQSNVQRALACLPEKKRVLLVLRELEQLSTQDIATTLEMPVGSVYSGLHEARKEFLKVYRRQLARERGP